MPIFYLRVNLAIKPYFKHIAISQLSLFYFFAFIIHKGTNFWKNGAYGEFPEFLKYDLSLLSKEPARRKGEKRVGMAAGYFALAFVFFRPDGS